MMRRQSALLASKRIQTQITQIGSDDETTALTDKPNARPSPAKVASKRVPRTRRREQDVDAFKQGDDASPPQSPARRVKRVKRVKTAANPTATAHLHNRLFSTAVPASSVTPGLATCCFPLRQHAVAYHRPLLLHGDTGGRGRSALLSWYDGVTTNRSMPWRKPFIDPADFQEKTQLRQALTQRAYEVFISEIMLQQTRVATVIDYWNRWMEKWPTIYDLAKADEDDVMSAWRGLGYYSRCKRILEACRIVVQHAEWDGLMPEEAKELEAHIPGVGPYTAGAISSIVFGRPAPMVDGNVLRVLSRQMGLLGDTKTDKTIIDLIWAAARSLVEVVAEEATVDRDGESTGCPKPTNGPGRWGQAMMELGSTICTPNPDCSTCPISVTCRAYQEGTILAGFQGLGRGPDVPAKSVDIEDACQLCERFLDVVAEETPQPKPAKKSKQASLSSFFAPTNPKAPPMPAGKGEQHSLSAEALKIVTSHARRFPVKAVKKALREQETLVCAIQRTRDGMFLLQRRPEKGKSSMTASALQCQC